MTVNAATHAEIAALLPRLRRVARAITFQRDDACDLVQVALERAREALQERLSDQARTVP